MKLENGNAELVGGLCSEGCNFLVYILPKRIFEIMNIIIEFILTADKLVRILVRLDLFVYMDK